MKTKIIIKQGSSMKNEKSLQDILTEQLKGEREVNPKMKMTDAQINDLVADVKGLFFGGSMEKGGEVENKESISFENWEYAVQNGITGEDWVEKGSGSWYNIDYEMKDYYDKGYTVQQTIDQLNKSYGYSIAKGGETKNNNKK